MPASQPTVKSLNELSFKPIVPQDLQTSDGKELKTQEKIIAELVKLREDDKVSKEKIQNLLDQIELYKRLDDSQKQQIKYLTEALDARKEAAAAIEQRDKVQQTRIDKLESETQRLAKENEKLRRSRNRQAIFSGIIGIALGALLL